MQLRWVGPSALSWRLPPTAPWAWVGVDIGLKGGLAVLRDGHEPNVVAMPLVKRDGEQHVDVSVLTHLLLEVRREFQVTAAVEQPFLKGRQGGALTIGKNWGIVLAAFHAANVPVRSPRPQDWQDEILAGIVHDDPKIRAAEYVRAHFPHVSLRATKKSTTDHDGIIDALCIAAWLRRRTGAADVP